ncbi:MAG TPA: AtpZ/AtpI family protein [Tepidisphaeraceae bacterium]|jgi:F0F1-type ATP synthase assembly protein I|nr:AtpZ/AtpI family protein [Tepidisphaeraceae bacterium]
MAAENEGSGPSKRPVDDARQAQGWYALAGIGFEFVAAVLLFGGIGWWLDGHFDTSPWLLIVGAGLGFTVGLWMMVKAANRSFKSKS